MAYERNYKTAGAEKQGSSYATSTTSYAAKGKLQLFSGNDFTCQGTCRSTIGCSCGKRPGFREQ